MHETTRQALLASYGIDPAARLGQGMEAEVYARDAQTVFKLYTGTTRRAALETLREFYATLDHRLPYALPRIAQIHEAAGCLVVLEQRLPGAPLAGVLPGLPTLDRAIERTVAAALALGRVAAPAGFSRYKLLDDTRLSQRTHGDWHVFLRRMLSAKLPEIGPALRRDVPAFDAKVQRMQAMLAAPYSGEYRLIHGDFFPGNLLVDADLNVTALLDFGVWTMYGDPLFDLATGWVFFDMYDELRANVRERYLAVLLEHLGGDARPVLHRYVLLYCMLTANFYAADCSDGHYQWCVALLSDETFWRWCGD